MILLVVSLLIAPCGTGLQPVGAAVPANEPAPALPEERKLSAPQAVRRGNEHLLGGDPTAALKAYRRAEELEPDAPEIAFVEGLAHYDLGEFNEARERFRKAATSADYALADDAHYSLGTCDHAEALATTDNPKAALGLLEGAMRRYHGVLANQPDHQAARDANFKAASMWRQIKQQLQQQEQQQSQDGDKDENEDQKDQESSPGEKQDGDEEQQPQESDEQPGDQQDQPDQQQASSSEKEAEPQSAAEQKEQIPKEQAQRKLREMMQALRDRQKLRKQRVQTLPVTPVEKDW